MSLNTQQRATLKADILANQALSAWVQERRDDLIAAYYNEPASPAFTVWRTNVATAEIGPKLNYQAVAALTAANRDRATTFVVLNPQSFNASADIASYWDTTFSGALEGQGAATRAALQALWRRVITKAERLFATGTGTDAVPGTPGWQGTVSVGLISDILNGG